jgi:hypothetical protein
MRQKGKGKLTEQKMQREIKRGRKWKSRIGFSRENAAEKFFKVDTNLALIPC